MAIKCGPEQVTISGSDSLVCGYLIRILDIRPTSSQIEIMIGGWSQMVYTSGVTMVMGSEVWTLFLISKDTLAGTAVIKFTVSDNPCAGVTCPDTCVGQDLWSQRCDINYDSVLVPTGYSCELNALKEAGSLQCKTTTHVLDLTISPYSWYTPQGAADYLITRLADINATIINWLTPFTGWTLTYTEIINDGVNVVIRIHLNDGSTQAPPRMLSTSNIQTLAIQLGLIEIGLLVVAIGVIFIGIGLIVGFALTKLFTGAVDAAKQYTPEEVVNLVINDPNSIVASQLNECDKNFGTDAVSLKLCYDSVIVGAQNGLADNLKLPPPTTDAPSETQTCLDKYLTDRNWANYQTCLKAVKDKAGKELGDAVTCQSGQYYDVNQGKCIDATADCWIPGLTPGSCILSASTGTTIALIGGGLIGVYVLISLLKK